MMPSAALTPADLDQGLRGVGAWFGSPDSSAPTTDRPATDPSSSGMLSMFGLGHLVGDLGQGFAQEGLAGLGDMSGMLDRQHAQRELADKFDIVTDDQLAERKDAAGNVVTPEQFQQLARTYSDIRLDRSDLLIDSSDFTDPAKAAAFEQDTMGDIGNLMQTRSGRELIDNLSDQVSDHKTTINLNRDSSGNPDTSNAEGGGNPTATGSDHDYTGKDARIKYVPGDAGGIQQPDHPQPWLPMRSDITLFHELVHAFHATEGDISQGLLTTQRDEGANAIDVGEMRMEYQAVGLGVHADNDLTENAYRKERAAIGASGVGARTSGGVGDADVVQRNQYLWAPHTP